VPPVTRRSCDGLDQPVAQGQAFLIRPLRFRFVAQDPIFFPVHKPGNILRGAFGHLFRSLACRCPSDIHAADCPYARIFEPKPLVAGPSGLADLPRPFVFRAAHLDGLRIAPGCAFHFDVNLFTADPWPIPHFEATFARLATEGLGPGRGRAQLQGVDSSVVELSLAPEGARQVTVHFVTPTELKAAEGMLSEPTFEILVARLRDRIANLSEQYGHGPIPLDFRAFAERARSISCLEAKLEQVSVERQSSRTGQTHPLSGFIGQATYAGDLGEFLPYLKIGQHTGVGRQTVWGKGQLQIT